MPVLAQPVSSQTTTSSRITTSSADTGLPVVTPVDRLEHNPSALTRAANCFSSALHAPANTFDRARGANPITTQPGSHAVQGKNPGLDLALQCGACCGSLGGVAAGLATGIPLIIEGQLVPGIVYTVMGGTCFPLAGACVGMLLCWPLSLICK